jgi:hypothetical protein
MAFSAKALVVPLLVLVAASACVAPTKPDARALPCAQPGWGRVLSPRETHLTVRAVEASAKPSTPPMPRGKPGWDRN